MSWGEGIYCNGTLRDSDCAVGFGGVEHTHAVPVDRRAIPSELVGNVND